MNKKYKTIDLCAGIGGIRKGFELTGCFENVLSAEIDKHAAKTYQHLYGDDPLNDLTSEEFKEMVENTEYDVLLAGFPCQAFSSVGKKLGFRDKTRGTIFFDIADIISRTRPKAVFLENVENLLSHDKGNTIKTIIETLEDELEYKVIGVTQGLDGSYLYSNRTLVRNTKNFGLPQNRPRVYIMAFNKVYFGDAIKKLSNQLPIGRDEKIFEDIESILDTDVDDKYYMAQGYLNTLKRHKAKQKENGNGFGYCVVNSSMNSKRIANTILATGGSGKERNLIYQPKDGVAGKKLPGRKTELNNEGIRVMTPTEWGRLQGFIGYAFVKDGKETFNFPAEMTDGQKYKQFGNSVSIPVIETMAEFMLACFSDLNASQEEIVKQLASYSTLITKHDVIEALGITTNQANYLLRKMTQNGLLTIDNYGRYSKYRLAES